MVKPDLDLWTGTDPIFRLVNRFCILCLIGSRVGSGNSRVGSGFSFCSPIFISQLKLCNLNYTSRSSRASLRTFGQYWTSVQVSHTQTTLRSLAFYNQAKPSFPWS
ncbi:hypothetical protein HanLR1_Chr08g0282771 [Helianthus annuus]|nr:hypothetical protein HanLR1_Chr08g0282771 [Helianthus annuus]